jgi:hypothetical protein
MKGGESKVYGNLQEEVERVRHELMATFRETLPSRQFSATIILATVSLGLVAEDIGKAQSLEERRRLLNEFTNRKAAIEKGIKLLRETRRRRRERIPVARGRALP